LAFYSSVFGFVEINLGSYNTMSMTGAAGPLEGSGYGREREKDTSSWLGSAARKWHKQTPPNFRFSIKIPERLLGFGQDRYEDSSTRIRDSDTSALGRFLEMLAPIEEKVIAVVISVPASLTLSQGRGWLEGILEECTYHGYSAAVQLDHMSWHQDLSYNILKRHNAALVWSGAHSYNYYPAVTTTDFLYVRLVPSSYNSKPNLDNFILWSKKIKATMSQEEIKSTVAVLDTPLNVNNFLKAYELPERSYRQRNSSTNDLKDNTRKNLADTIRNFSSSPSLPLSSLTPETNTKRKIWNDRIIVCVDLNAFYPSCEELRDPSLKGKAHAVIMTEEKEGNITKGVVSSCSYEARKYGIKSAMSLSKARALYPNLILKPVDMPYYSEISQKIMTILGNYADVLEQASIDEAFLDCSAKIGSDTPENYSAKIKQAIRERQGLLCSVGVAHTRSAAKIASDYQKPDGLTVVYPEDLKAFLSSLEVERVAGIGPKTKQALREMKIMTLGQLADADVQMLKKRFGKNGYWMWKVANGTDDEPIHPRGDHVSLSTEYTLSKFTRDRIKLQEFLQELVDELHGRAERRGYIFRTVGIKLVRTDFSVETREISFDEFQSSRESISSVIGSLLDRFSLLEDPSGSHHSNNDNSSSKHLLVRKVGLRISNITRRIADAKDVGEMVQNQKDLQKTLVDYF
jgi:DNA polymerase IV (DinB-like DNA polymerase)